MNTEVVAFLIAYMEYSNVLSPLTFFLDFFHFTFCYELIVCPEFTCFMKGIRYLLTLIYRHKTHHTFLLRRSYSGRDSSGSLLFRLLQLQQFYLQTLQDHWGFCAAFSKNRFQPFFLPLRSVPHRLLSDKRHTSENTLWSAAGVVFCCKRFILVIDMFFIILWQIHDIRRHIICQTPETAPVQIPCPLLGRSFLIACVTIKARCPMWLNARLSSDARPASLQYMNFSHPNCLRTLVSKGFNDFCSFWFPENSEKANGSPKSHNWLKLQKTVKYAKLWN